MQTGQDTFGAYKTRRPSVFLHSLHIMQATYLALILAVAIFGSVSTQADLRLQSWANNYGEDLNFECSAGGAINSVAVSYDMNFISSTTSSTSSSTTFSSINSSSIINSNNNNSPRFKLACRPTTALSSNCKWTDGSKRSFPPSCPADDKGWAVTGMSTSHSDWGSVVNTKCCAFSEDYEVLPNATCHMIWVDQYVTERTLRHDEIVQGVDVIQTSNSRSQDVYIFKVCAFIKKPTPTTSATSERRQESTPKGQTSTFLETTRNAVITPQTTMTIIEGVTPYMTTYTEVVTRTAMMITTDVTKKTPTTTTTDTIRETPTMTSTDVMAKTPIMTAINVMTKTPTVTTTDVTTKTPQTTTSETIRETPTMISSTDVIAKTPTMTTIDVMTKTPTVTTTDITTKTPKTTSTDTIRETPTMISSTDVIAKTPTMTTIDFMTKTRTVTTTDVTTKTSKTTSTDTIRKTPTMISSTDVIAKTPTMTTIDVMTKTPTVTTTDVTTKTPKTTTTDTIKETPTMTSTDVIAKTPTTTTIHVMTRTPSMTTTNITTKTPPTTTTDTKRETPLMTTVHVMTKTPTMITTDVTTPTTTTTDAVRETPTMTTSKKTTATTTTDIKTKAPTMTTTDVIRSTPIMTAMTTPTRRTTTTTTDKTTTTADFMRKTPTMPAHSVFTRTRNMTTTDVTTQAPTTTLTDLITKTLVMTTTRNTTARSTSNSTTSEHAITGSSDRYQDVSLAVESLMSSVEMDLLRHRPWLRTNVTFVSNIVWTLSQIMDENVTVLSDANIGYRLLSAIDIVGHEGLLSTHDHFLTVAPNLAIAARTVNDSSFAGLVLTAHAREDNRFQQDEVRIFTDTRAVPPKEVSSLVLPASLLTSLSSGTRIATAVHISGKVFEAIERARRNETWNETVAALTDDNVTKVNSYVMAASVVGHEVMNLKDPVKINFVHIDKNAVNPRCVFWNTSIEEGRGGWSTAGCWRVDPSSTDTRTSCECNHLTSFALLMDVYQRGDTVPTLHRQVLSAISYTGCGVSLLALALTILTYCIWNPTSSAKKGNEPKGRRRRTIFNKPTMILLNLCTSMALSNLVFVAGLQSYTMGHHWACKVVAMLLHLCLLSSLCWMAVEAFYMYLSLVRVFRTRVTRIILKCSAFAWGLPLLAVIITAAVDMDNYASLTSGVCWLSGIAFYAAFVAPVGLLLLFNSVIFTLVLRVILTLADNRLERRRSSKAATQLRRATGVVILLGLTWGFGFLAIDGASLVFYYLFAVCNSFQGLFIFLFYCTLNAEVRAAWKQSFGQWMDGKKQTGKANPEPRATAAERKKLLNHPDAKVAGSTIPSDPFAVTATSSGHTGLTSLDDGTGVALTTSISINDRDNANQ